jgi:hypothetical protein
MRIGGKVDADMLALQGKWEMRGKRRGDLISEF